MREINIEVAAEQDMAISITFDYIINHRKLHDKFIKTSIIMLIRHIIRLSINTKNFKIII